MKERRACSASDLLEAYALSRVSDDERSLVETHLSSCPHCQKEYASIKATVGGFPGWPASELSPSASLWSRLAERVGKEGWSAIDQELPLAPHWADLDWESPAPGIYCKILSTDAQRKRVSMLVRLDPGVDYPPHTHAGLEELFLLDGELWIDDRKLYPGDYNRAEPNSSDQRVWSQTGCTCVLVTSPDDSLR